MHVLWLIPSLLAGLCLYLASPHQQLRPARGNARILRGAAAACAVLGTGVAVWLLGWWAGGFAALTALMFAMVLLPYADAWRRVRKARAHVG